MKRIFITLIVLTTIIGSKHVKAQFESFGGIALATGGKYEYNELEYFNRSFGFDLRAGYNYNKKIDIVTDIKFYLPKEDESASYGSSKVTAFAFNLNAHYILNPRSRDNYRIYILGGAYVGMWQIKDDRAQDYGDRLDINKLKVFPGANVGAGMQLSFDAGFMFFAEAKYVLAKTNQLVFTPGILFYF